MYNFKNIIKMKQELGIKEEPTRMKVDLGTTTSKKPSLSTSLDFKKPSQSTKVNSISTTKSRGAPESRPSRSMSSVQTRSKSSLAGDDVESLIRQDAMVNSPLISWMKQQL